MKLKQIFLFVLVVSAFLLQGCTLFTGPKQDISRLDAYTNLVGHIFRLQGDCYVYVFDDERTKMPSVSDKRLFPSSMGSDSVGKDINGQIIVGTLKKGTEFKLESVWQQKVISSYSSIRFFFIISLEASRQVPWTKLNAIDLTDCNSTDFFKKKPMLPMFLPEYVKSVDAGNNDK
jgi:hypothetical protein